MKLNKLVWCLALLFACFAPVADAGPDQTVECASHGGTAVTPQRERVQSEHGPPSAERRAVCECEPTRLRAQLANLGDLPPFAVMFPDWMSGAPTRFRNRVLAAGLRDPVRRSLRARFLLEVIRSFARPALSHQLASGPLPTRALQGAKPQVEPFFPLPHPTPSAFDGIVCGACRDVHTLIFRCALEPLFMRVGPLWHAWGPRHYWVARGLSVCKGEARFPMQRSGDLS
jgi:hypothetical protein